jgi:hypothetical protein
MRAKLGLLLPLLAACAGGEPGAASLDASAAPDAAPDAAYVDAGAPDAAEAPDAGPPRPPDVCDELGLPRRPFARGAETFRFGDLAGDFTVTGLDGASWSLEGAWTGCESFTFLGYIPTSGAFEDQLFGSSLDPLVFETAPNAHFFFLSFERTEAARRARLEPLRARLDEVILGAFGPGPIAERQRARFHVVVEHPTDAAGSLGAFYRDYLAYAADPASAVDLGDRGRAPPPLPFALAIDRDQRWDAGESLAQFVGGEPAFRMASYLPRFFDHRARLRDADDAGVTRVPVLAETTTGRVFVREVALPDDATLAATDTLEVDVRVVCHARNVFGCSEWDRNAYVHVCSDATCAESLELVRWITPYWRRGEQRWFMDASPLLPLLEGGGRRWLRVTLGPDWERPTEWEVEVALRLSRRGAGSRARGAVRAFVGGEFDARYNDRAPFEFTPPATARRVELVVIVSGHGQVERTNCAEWCDHRHRFAINGVRLAEVRHPGRVGARAGCGPAADRGAPPGQWGNWAPERAYWCPGAPVDALRLDLTEHVRPGEANRLTYEAGLGASGPPGGGTIDLSAYVVWSE